VNSFNFCCNLCLNNQHPKAAAAAAAAAETDKKDLLINLTSNPKHTVP
jgi:hypothetical protein